MEWHSIWHTRIFQVPPVTMVNFRVAAVVDRPVDTYTKNSNRNLEVTLAASFLLETSKYVLTMLSC